MDNDEEIGIVICASCGDRLYEQDAVLTKSGLLCEVCATRLYPETDHVFPY